jgi:hypothetical protein
MAARTKAPDEFHPKEAKRFVTDSGSLRCLQRREVRGCVEIDGEQRRRSEPPTAYAAMALTF